MREMTEQIFKIRLSKELVSEGIINNMSEKMLKSLIMHALQEIYEDELEVEEIKMETANVKKPMASAWHGTHVGTTLRTVPGDRRGDTGVMYCMDDGDEWCVRRLDDAPLVTPTGYYGWEDGRKVGQGGQAAADAWVREHESELDWTLPTVEYAFTKDDLIACALAARSELGWKNDYGYGLPPNEATIGEVRLVLNGGRTRMPAWDEAVKKHAETLIAQRQKRCEKPVAGEWEGNWRDVMIDGLTDGVAFARDSGAWLVYNRPSGKRCAEGKADDLQSARLAADAWVRAHADELDWMLPPEMNEETSKTRAYESAPGGFTVRALIEALQHMPSEARIMFDTEAAAYTAHVVPVESVEDISDAISEQIVVLHTKQDESRLLQWAEKMSNDFICMTEQDYRVWFKGQSVETQTRVLRDLQKEHCYYMSTEAQALDKEVASVLKTLRAEGMVAAEEVVARLANEFSVLATQVESMVADYKSWLGQVRCSHCGDRFSNDKIMNHIRECDQNPMVFEIRVLTARVAAAEEAAQFQAAEAQHKATDEATHVVRSIVHDAFVEWYASVAEGATSTEIEYSSGVHVGAGRCLDAVRALMTKEGA